MAKDKVKKTYVVFTGIKPGIYDTWAECKEQIFGVKGAKYKSYLSAEEAAEDFAKHRDHTEIPQEEIDLSINTDASCTGQSGPGQTEFRVVHTKTREPIFESKVYPWGTNNIGEFLALVKAMQFLEKQGEKGRLIFTDSITAMSWVKKKKINSSLEQSERTEELYHEIQEALKWLETQNVKEYSLEKWRTDLMGEIPADYDRKSSR